MDADARARLNQRARENVIEPLRGGFHSLREGKTYDDALRWFFLEPRWAPENPGEVLGRGLVDALAPRVPLVQDEIQAARKGIAPVSEAEALEARDYFRQYAPNAAASIATFALEVAADLITGGVATEMMSAARVLRRLEIPGSIKSAHHSIVRNSPSLDDAYKILSEAAEQHRRGQNIREMQRQLDALDADSVEFDPNIELQFATRSEFEGVREASAILREAGVPHNVRKQVLESFDRRSMIVRKTREDDYALRYYDGIDAEARGRYLFKFFPATRQSLALKPTFNQMTHFKQWRIPENTTVFEGPAARQGPYYPGGQIQLFVQDPDALQEP